MAIIKTTGEARWDFKLVDAGWHNVVIGDGIMVLDKDKDGNPKDKKSLQIPLILEGDTDLKLSIFCPIGTTFGARKMIDVLCASGLAPVLLKEKKIDVEEGVDDAVINSENFLLWFSAKLPGKPLFVEVAHETYKDKVNANVVGIKPSEGKGRANIAKPVTTTAATVEPEGW